MPTKGRSTQSKESAGQTTECCESSTNPAPKELQSSTGLTSVDSPPEAQRADQLCRQPTFSPGVPQDSMSRKLFHHYDQAIAPRMVWVDSADNPFRNVVMQVATQSPALMSSILTLASGDLRARSHDALVPISNHSNQLNRYQEQTLSHLVNHLKDRIENQPGVTHLSQLAGAVLATFFLSHLSINLGDYTARRLHIRATWSMIEHWNLSPPNVHASLAPIRDFLLEEVYILKVAEFVSSFQPWELPYGAASTLSIEKPFIQYCHTIMEVSHIERNKRAYESTTNPQLPLRVLLRKLQEARELSKAYRLMFESSVESRDTFNYVIDLFHYAGVIYTCQVVNDEPESRKIAIDTHYTLLELLRQCSDLSLIAQDLAWPIFLAGTECYDSPEDRLLVEEKMGEIMGITGFTERQRVLFFLKEYWDLWDKDPSTNWIDMAEAYAKRGEPLFIF
ncbi:hypothetical protein DV735_g1993, partial [Chaetothyriales sp. CBS 134920]